MPTNMVFSYLSYAIFLAGVTTPVWGQITPSTEPAASNAKDAAEDIIVTGIRPGAEPIRDKAISFVREVTGSPVDGQFARWNEPICPKIMGLTEQNAVFVALAIRSTASDAGAAVGGSKCHPNIVVTFTSQAASLMKIIAKRDPSAFSTIDPSEKKMLLESAMPVRWWYSTLTEGSDGHQIGTSSAALGTMQDFPAPRSGKFLSSYHSTLIGTKLRVNTKSVAVVVDVDAASGSTLKSLSAYIAMVSLAPIKLGMQSDRIESILSLFPMSPDKAKLGLSRWDKAYLSSVYKIPFDREARVQRSALVSNITNKIDK